MKALAIALICIMAAVLLSVPAVAASDGCEAAGEAEDETLYLCYVDGVRCVWDPSPALKAGIMSCEWD